MTLRDDLEELSAAVRALGEIVADELEEAGRPVVDFLARLLRWFTR